MSDQINLEKLLDENQFEDFDTYYDYKRIFVEIATGQVTKNEAKEIYRALCKEDIYFLLRYAMDRPDVQHPWLYKAMNELKQLDTHFLWMAARGHYKSTIGTTAMTIQDILNDPNQTFCIFSVTDTIAKPFLKQITDEFRGNDFLRYLFPEIIPKDNSDDLGYERLRVKRSSRKKEWTVESSGVITKMPTSRHYDVVIYDDLITPEIADEMSIVEQTYERWRMSLNCVTTEYKIRIFGTPYHYMDAYNQIEKTKMFEVRKYPCYNDDNEPIFMARKDIEFKRQIMGQRVFNSQMLLDPTPTDEATFNIDKLVYGCDIDDIDKIGRRFHVVLDPAISKKKTSDYCVSMVVETFMYQNLLHMAVKEYFHIKEGNKNPTRVLNVLIDQCVKYGVRRPIIETVAFQEALVYRFNEVCRERGLKLGVDQFKSSTNKEVRIMRLDPIVNMGRLHVEPEHKEVIEQLRGFPHTHDDHIDCLATAYHYAPKKKDDKAPPGNVDRRTNRRYNSVRAMNNKPYKRDNHAINKRSYGRAINTGLCKI